MAFRRLKRVFSEVSSRVKCVELHPTEPMLAEALFDGTVQIFNTNDFSLLLKIHVSPSKPVRCVRWMPSIQAVITAGDDYSISAWDYNTGSLIASYPNAHTDFIRAIAVHPTQPIILSSSDDYLIKRFKIENNKIIFQNEYKGHKHFVMDVKFNPKDPSTFASASLDTSIKFWNITTTQSRFNLNGHEAGVNCVEFFPGSDKPYIATGSDDFSIRIWDYQTRACIQKIQPRDPKDLSVLAGNVTSLKFHPTFPLLISTSEDNTFILWNSITFSMEKKMDVGKKRGWTVDCNDTLLALGFDEGSVVYQFGSSSILITSDPNGKTFWARNNDIQSTNLSQASDPEDGKPCDISIKDVATSEIYPGSIAFNSTGRYVAVAGGNEYNVYSSLAWRSKAFGKCKEFVWGIGDTFATRSVSDQITIVTGFDKEEKFNPLYGCNSIFGGTLLGVASDDAICFHDWMSFSLVRQIDVKAIAVWWSQEGNQVAIATNDQLFVLTYNNEAENEEETFEVTYEGDDIVKSGCWSRGTFFFCDEKSVSFVVAGHKETFVRLDKPLTITGYIPKHERIFLCDKDYNFYSYSVPLAVLDAFMNILTMDEEEELAITPDTIPPEWHGRISAVLEENNDYVSALEFAESDEKRFELALKIPDIKLAVTIARKTNSLSEWRQISTIAMKTGEMDLLKEALTITGDESGLLLLHSVCGNKKEIIKLADSTEEARNVAFAGYFAAGLYSKCIDLLLATGRAPEAALMARTYCPSRMNECAIKWKESLVAKGDKLTADSIALPSECPELFGIDPQEQEADKVEEPKKEEDQQEPEQPEAEPPKQEKEPQASKEEKKDDIQDVDIEDMNDEDLDALIGDIDENDLDIDED